VLDITGQALAQVATLVTAVTLAARTVVIQTGLDLIITVMPVLVAVAVAVGIVTVIKMVLAVVA
jgi:hypothetical protein